MEDTFAVTIKPYAAAWGWNSGGRAGNVTKISVNEPTQLQKTRYDKFIGCATGKHHTLLINEEGKVFTFGDGSKGQLGYGNMFTLKPEKGGVLQSLPRQITPSGIYKDNSDLRIAQVVGGGAFSVAREACTDEGVALVTDFARIESALKKLMTIYPDSGSIKNAWKYVRQERYHIGRRSEGNLLVWGTGENGQLGLDKHITFSPYPQPILKLKNVCITRVAAGERHVLAVDLQGRLYSWGCGNNGRLGHGDFNDRYTPEIVSFFNSLFVEYIAAGDAHSAVLTTSKSGLSRATQKSRLACFGRGAHGRLGNGTNRNVCTPVLVSKWPPSVAGSQLHQVACGGAHTVVLASIESPKCLANPHGRTTFVLTFGYGANGQLGTGYRYDSFVPIRARLPKCEIIVGVSAGRSWTVARSISGALFTWGKGLRGQLGQGDEHRFSLAPRKLACAGSYLQVASGYAHNVALAVHKRYLNDKIVETRAKEEGDNYNPFNPCIESTLTKRDCISKYQFDCCRRFSVRVPYRKRCMRFSCEDCGVASICYACASLCHRGHLLRDVIALPCNTTSINSASKISSSISRTDTGGVYQEVQPQVVNKSGFRRSNAAGRKNAFNPDNTVLSHNCSILFFPTRIRPKRRMLEIMPRPSILDITVGEQKIVLPNAPVRSKKRGKKDPFLEVPRPSKTTEKENKARLKFEINRAMHIKEKQLSENYTAPNEAASEVMLNVPCCECGLHHSCCRLVPSVQEHPFEELMAERERRIIRKKKSAASPTPNAKIVKKGSLSPRTNPPQSSGRGIPAVSALTLTRKKPSQIGSAAPSKQSKKMAPSLFSKKVTASVKVVEKEEPLDPLATTKALIKKLRGLYGGREVKDEENLSKLQRDFACANAAAATIQRLVRRYHEKLNARKAQIKLRVLQHQVCAQHYNEKILGVILGKVTRAYEKFRQLREVKLMRIEENTMQKFAYYNKLQSGLLGIEAVDFSVKLTLGEMSTHVPRVKDCVVTDAMRPTFAFTWNSIRSQQLRLDHTRRISSTLLSTLTRDIPRFLVGSNREGRFFDLDLAAFTDRYVRDMETENWRTAVRQRQKELHEMREKVAALALERLKQKTNAKKALKIAADALNARNKGSAPPPPPPGPPPPHVLRANRAKEKLAKLKRERDAIQKEMELEDAPFDILKKRPKQLYRKRRHSISDPSKLGFRISTMRHHLQTANRFKRRNSLPYNFSKLISFTRPPPLETIAQVDKSLELFETRLSYLKRVREGIDRSRTDPLYASQKPPKYFERNARMLFEFNFCDPRLPFEMNTLLVDGYRRRTIGEPERFRRQLEMSMETRENFSDVVFTCSEAFHMKRRRRSFDHGEYLDIVTGVDDVLGFEYEDVPQVVTVAGLRRDAADMEFVMLKSGFIDLDEVSVSTRQRMKKLQADDNKRVTRSKVKLQQSNELFGGSGSSKKNGAFSRSEKLSPEKAGSFKANTGSSKKAYFSTARNASERYQEFLAEVGDASHLVAVQEGDEEDSYGFMDPDENSASIYGTGATYSQFSYTGRGDVQVWQEHYTDDGRTYYYNESTGESQWDYPSGNVQLETQNQDENGYWYWWNVVTGESKWM